MNKFNEVFLIIKKHCAKQRPLAEVDCFETISEEAGVPLDELEIYLNHLQNMGLIKYSCADRYICLTPFGRKQDKLIGN